MAGSLGTIYAELRLQLDSFRADIEAAQIELASIGQEAQNKFSDIAQAGEQMKNVGKNMSMYVTAPLVTLGTLSAHAQIQFEQAMSSVRAVGDITAEEYERLKELAIQQGIETKFSALESAQAMFELTKLGFDANEILSALPATLSLAAAGGTDLNDASKIVAQSMNMFNETAEETGRYADVFAKAAAMGALDVKTLGEALSYAGPSASAMNYSLEETAAILAVFSDAGIESTRAGTTFEAMMRDMKQKALDAGGALKFMSASGEDVSVSLYDTEGNARSMLDIIRDLEVGFAGMTAEQRDAALAGIVNTQGLRGMNVLLQKGSDYLADYTTAIEGSSGAGKEMADVMMGNLAGTLEQLRGSMETAGIAVGDVLAPAIQFVAESIKNLVDAFTSLPDDVQKGIVIFLAIIAAVGPLLVIFGTILALLPSIAAGFAILKAAMIPVVLPTLGIVAAIAAVIAIVVLLVKNWETIKQKASEIWTAVKDKFVEIFTGIGEFFMNLWTSIVDFFSGALEAIVSFFVGLPDRIVEGLTALGAILVTFFTETLPTYVGYGIGWLVRTVYEGILAVIGFFRDLPENLVIWFTVMIEKLVLWVTTLSETLRTGVSEAIAAVVQFFSELPGKLWTWLQNTITKITTFASMAKTHMMNAGRNALTGFISTIKDLPTKLWSIITEAGQKLMNAGSYLWDKAKEAASNLWEGFKDGLGIHSPSYIERAMDDIVVKTKDSLVQMKRDMHALDSLTSKPIGSAFSIANAQTAVAGTPKTSILAFDGMFSGATFTVSSKDDAVALAQEFYRLTQTRARSKGVVV